MIYRKCMSMSLTLIIVLASLSNVITVFNVVENGVIRVFLYSQVSYTRRVDIDTWRHSSIYRPYIRVRVSNGPKEADISLSRYLLHDIWSVWASNRGWFQGIVVSSYTNIYVELSNDMVVFLYKVVKFNHYGPDYTII